MTVKLKILIFLLILVSPAFAEKCRAVDTTSNYKLEWSMCRNAQSSAQFLADVTQSDVFAVEHRLWWGRKWRVKVIPSAILHLDDPPEEEIIPRSRRPELPKT